MTLAYSSVPFPRRTARRCGRFAPHSHSPDIRCERGDSVRARLAEGDAECLGTRRQEEKVGRAVQVSKSSRSACELLRRNPCTCTYSGSVAPGGGVHPTRSSSVRRPLRLSRRATSTATSAPLPLHFVPTRRSRHGSDGLASINLPTSSGPCSISKSGPERQDLDLRLGDIVRVSRSLGRPLR